MCYPIVFCCNIFAVFRRAYSVSQTKDVKKAEKLNHRLFQVNFAAKKIDFSVELVHVTLIEKTIPMR